MSSPNVFAGTRVIITGGLGFIGSNLAERLVELGSDVVLIDSLVPEYGGNLFNIEGFAPRVRVNISDVRDAFSLGYLLEGADYLFNLAGQTSHLDSMNDPFTDLDINCKAQLAILETCRRVNPGVKIVFASTRQIYGRPVDLPVTEKHPLAPVDVNGINKLAGEQFHTLYNHVYGLRSCVLRLTNTYGPRMRVRDARQTFLGIWIRHALEGKPFEVWGGEQLRDFTYVADAVEAFLLAAAGAEGDGRVFNLGGGEVVALKDLAGVIARLVPGTAFELREFPSDRKRIDIGDYYADASAIRDTLGWAPTVNLEAGLKKTIDYYRSHLPRYV